MHARFYAPSAREGAEEIELPDDEAQHLSRVLRLKAGDPLTVFNGAGDEFAAIVGEVTKTRVRVRVLARVAAAREAPVAVTLAQAVLKGDKMDGVVRDAVMLGVAAIHPLVTARSEVTLATLARSAREERWHRVAVSSAKQCRRAVVPVIATPAVFDDASLARLPAPRFMLVEPGTGPAGSVMTLADAAPAAATVLVGPEGGWTPEEVALGLRTAEPLRLGASTLRADAAALVAITSLLTRWRAL